MSQARRLLQSRFVDGSLSTADLHRLVYASRIVLRLIVRGEGDERAGQDEDYRGESRKKLHEESFH